MIPQHIFQVQFKLGKRATFFANDIIFFEGEINYTRIHFAMGKTRLISKTLSNVEERVNANCFLRINRKYLVNQKFISKIGRKSIVLLDGRILPISRRKRFVLA
ncbi:MULTISPECIES: LytR/AlgR family response regulator transcription factor [Arcicella]|uniref:LytTR family DNA-binding domain-containing protein n=1 Tax=Arcicella lustrica TaxID=2984196 RepID=A0ABU5SQC9_9BACT|nr:LytTR family DNA-binding domain-containing protein [Arcicella sp. DC25W]MEA5429465.1 LytTR family DNA-binding domain-containing protein [Arcicella sp. DC25W]